MRARARHTPRAGLLSRDDVSDVCAATAPPPRIDRAALDMGGRGFSLGMTWGLPRQMEGLHLRVTLFILCRGIAARKGMPTAKGAVWGTSSHLLLLVCSKLVQTCRAV